MEILFRNRRRTAKLCMKVSCADERHQDIWHLRDYEVDKLKEILSLNEGYKWEPVRTGYAYENNLPLIRA